MDDPPATKRALLEGLARLLAELDFEHVLLAHGSPLIGDGRERLQELARRRRAHGVRAVAAATVVLGGASVLACESDVLRKAVTR